MNEPPPATSPRTVRPRKSKHTHRPIIALTESELLLEEGGLVLPARQLPHVLITEPSSIIVCQGFGPHLLELRRLFGKDDDFQYRVSPRHHASRNTDDGRRQHVTRIYDAVTNFVGFRNLEKNRRGGKRWNRYHYPLDPIHFIRASIDELYDEESTRLDKLLRFGVEVREWCKCQNLEVKPSAGGLAAQLLRDPRFYPESRRKMPSILNASARLQLPGNFYRLLAEPNPEGYTAAYLDMSNAHHEAARQIAFPNVNSLRAYGRWAEEIPRGDFAGLPSAMLARPGLFHVRLTVPHIPLVRHPPPYMERSGTKNAWLYSNELDVVEELGGEIETIYGAIVADDTEEGLNRYAEFAIREIRANPGYKPWLKPTLHATYGVLAARPVPFETGYHRAKGKLAPKGKLVPAEYPMGRVSIPVLARSTGRVMESAIVNVIHRGMIEAEVRKEVLRFAREMREAGRTVLAVYADSIFLEGSEVPLLPAPWRLAEQCTGLRFYSPTHFDSDQESRMPGIPRNLRAKTREDRLIRREMLVASMRSTKQP